MAEPSPRAAGDLVTNGDHDRGTVTDCPHGCNAGEDGTCEHGYASAETTPGV